MLTEEAFGEWGAQTVFLATGRGFLDDLAAMQVFIAGGAGLVSMSIQSFVNGLPFIDSVTQVAGKVFVVPGNCVPNGVLTKIAALGATDVVLLGGVRAFIEQVANLTRC